MNVGGMKATEVHENPFKSNFMAVAFAQDH
jgi:hypothetical protein